MRPRRPVAWELVIDSVALYRIDPEARLLADLDPGHAVGEVDGPADRPATGRAVGVANQERPTGERRGLGQGRADLEPTMRAVIEATTGPRDLPLGPRLDDPMTVQLGERPAHVVAVAANAGEP